MSLDQMKKKARNLVASCLRIPGCHRLKAAEMGCDIFFDWDSARSVEGPLPQKTRAVSLLALQV